MSSPRPWQAMAGEIDLPVPTAVWVLTAHVLTILSPLLVVWVVAVNEPAVAAVAAVPWAFYASAGVLVCASVAESAQNTLDRWYLTGTPPTLLDCVFNTLVVLGLGLTVVAVWGGAWTVILTAVACLAFVALYLTGGPTPVVQATVGLASAVALWRAFDDPVVFLSLVFVFVSLFFLDVMLRTMQQAWHGIVTIANAVGLMTTVIAIAAYAAGRTTPWPVVIGVGVVVVVVVVGLRPVLLRSPATPRRAERELSRA